MTKSERLVRIEEVVKKYGSEALSKDDDEYCEGVIARRSGYGIQGIRTKDFMEGYQDTQDEISGIEGCTREIAGRIDGFRDAIRPDGYMHINRHMADDDPYEKAYLEAWKKGRELVTGEIEYVVTIRVK